MARTSNSKLAKSNVKNRGTRGANTDDAVSEPKKATKPPSLGAMTTKGKAKASSIDGKTAPQPAEAAKDTTAEDKKVSQKLLETLERRRKNQQTQNPRMQLFSKPGGRRGRRPKGAAEYTPGNQEEEAYVLESDYEGLEYDTGIRVKEKADDRSYNMDRFEEYDEELNFDW